MIDTCDQCGTENVEVDWLDLMDGPNDAGRVLLCWACDEADVTISLEAQDRAASRLYPDPDCDYDNIYDACRAL